MNYMYSNMQQQMVRPAYPSSGLYSNRIRPVSSLEEARASVIDFDGSVFYFPDAANKRIYTKQINLDGTASINVYELKILQQPTAQPQMTDYITRDEFNEQMEKIRAIFAGQVPEQAPQNATPSVPSPQPVKKEDIKF